MGVQAKLDSSSSSVGSHRHHHHHHHHQQQQHQHRSHSRGGGSKMREPSVHSFSSASEISSSEISSDASSVHHRSTPKIAAVIIAAIIVITGLVGVTVYLVDSDHFGGGKVREVVAEEEVEIVEKVGPDTSLDFQTYRDDSASVMQKHQMTAEDAAAKENDPNLRNHQRKVTPRPNRFGLQRKTGTGGFRDRKDPEGPMDVSIYDDDYYDVVGAGEKEEGGAAGQERTQGLADERNSQKWPLSGDQYHHRRRRPPLPAPPRVSLTDGQPLSPSDGGRKQQQQQQNNQSGPPYGARLKGKDAAQMYDMAQYREEAAAAPSQHQQHESAAVLRRRQQLLQNLRARRYRQRTKAGQETGTGGGILQLDETMTQEELEDAPRPPGGSRGGVHVHMPVGEEEEDEERGQEELVQVGEGLTTLDRRPGRPVFHHLGPPGPGLPRNQAAFRRRQKLMELRRRQNVLQRRLGMLTQQQQQREQVVVNPVVKAKMMLRKFGDFVDLAKSEVAMIRNIARNITDSGRELNLWEMMSAVNATLRDRPDSPLGRLMSRFYARYLSEEGAYDFNSVSAGSVRGKKGLSSLLFLSFGIFLLNSVNDLMRRNQGMAGEQGRSFSAGDDAETSALKSLIFSQEEEEEMLDRVGLKEADEEEKSTTAMQPEKSTSLNSYLRLLMNLMNAYRDGSESDLQCLWSLYCGQLNRQASLGGVAGVVARINSVGMRVILETVPTRHASGLAARAIMKWEDMRCHEMFPLCDKDFGGGGKEDGEKEEEEEEE